MSDTEAVKRSTDALEEQKQAFLKQLAASAKREQIVERIDRYIAKARLDVEKKIQETNRLIEERTQTKASEDSDDDGVSNYDEVALFKTDPFVSDTDADGFTDGSEILSGYDPIDPRQEVLITYESPKESGIIRDDILAVTGIATADVPAGEQSAEKEQPAAIISGKALPYGFVTLYIFSTPVVVTVKTDADGTWNYRFDKELEDGTHEIYVGVTDNAGKIIAKSKPFTFVKEAEAFTSSNTTPAPLPVETPIPQSSFLSEYMVYLVLSISVVAIGLVLILLGLHLDARARKTLVQEAKPQM
jgi:hypothetical protein